MGESDAIFIDDEGNPLEFFLMSSAPKETRSLITKGKGIIVSKPRDGVYAICGHDVQHASGGCYSSKLIYDSIEAGKFLNPQDFIMKKNKKNLLNQEEEQKILDFLSSKAEDSSLNLTKKIVEEAAKLVGKDWKSIKEKLFEIFEISSTPLPVNIPPQNLSLGFSKIKNVILEKDDAEISNFLDRHAEVAVLDYYESAPSDVEETISEDELDSTLINRYLVKKLQRYTLCPTPVIIHALYVTNGSFHEARKYLLHGYEAYKDKIWTPEEDRILFEQDEEKIREVAKRKGQENVHKRVKYLEGV